MPAAAAVSGTCCAMHAMAGQDRLDELLQQRDFIY